jgi:hypothetical protein
MSIDKMLIDMIRKNMPTILAEEIIGVQPMDSQLRTPLLIVDDNSLEFFCARRDKEFQDWCEIHGIIKNSDNDFKYLLPSEEIKSLLLLRWK